jgi:large subunit ribosomal protein L2
MALRSFNPVTPSLRGTILVRRDELWKGKPVKQLTEGKHSSGGRNNHGRITVRFRGGGHKRTYRLVDFKRAPSSACRRRSNGWSTTRTAPRGSPC